MKKRTISRVAFLHLLYAFVLFGCTTIRVAGYVQNGRMQLMHGNPEVALSHFQNVAQLQPDYVLNHAIPHLSQSIWTYVGRAYYANRRIPEARQALEKARSLNESDQLAKIYLGLVLAQDGDPQRGLMELEAGLRGLNDWLEYIEHNVRQGHFWDPRRRIRTEIDRNIKMIESGDANLEVLTKSAEWIGLQIEKEVDRVRKDIYRDETRDQDDSDDFS